MLSAAVRNTLGEFCFVKLAVLGRICVAEGAVLPHVTGNWNIEGRTVVELWDEMEEGGEENDEE